MGRIFEYVVLLSSLSLILAVQQFKEPSHANNYERGKKENLTHTIKQYLPKDQNEFFNKKALPMDFQGRRRPHPQRSKQMRMSLGLHAFASKDPEWKGRKRNSSEPSTSYSNLSIRNISPSFSQALYSQRNSKNSWSVGFQEEISSQRLSKQYNPNNSFNLQNKRPEDFHRRYHKEGKFGRYQSYRTPKICDPCSSVPWRPLLKVPESYRQQRTHVTELHPAPQQNFNFDYHTLASNTHNVLLPPLPLVPPLEPIYDGTISNSFGLPVGNIPTGHGLLAPINHLTTTVSKYGTNNIDYSNSFNYFAPQGLLENHAFPELSPVPIVPIHDSGQFYQFDSTVPDLVPPPTKTLDVSKVVLTISEENSAKKREPSTLEIFNNHKPEKDLSPESNTVDSQTLHSQTKEKNQSKDFGKFEIVKSIPLAEFISSADFPQQDLPLYPPLQSEFSNDFVNSKEYHPQILFTDQSTSNFDFLVPPPKPASDLSFKLNKSFDLTHSKSELQGEFSAPKPLTSPSLSWLFSDHTVPPDDDSKSTASVSSFATETQEIASIVNSELRPVSPPPLPVTSPSVQNISTAKSKKIQIIIPYTTKSKNGHDNNAVESVQREVFQPPVSKSANENDSLRDFATSALPSLTHLLETNQEKKVIDEIEKQLKTENQQAGENKSRKYLNEMHHIIASNIRELLKKEIQKSQSDQNYPLQNNIDNWTALEYSNHKIVETKAPKEIINQALAVTSIPGTSISHLLLPSKKIPNEYFVTTPLPVYDEPSSSVYKAINSTVNSSPFTAKPYASTSVYNPNRTFKENGKENNENPLLVNHEKNYTELERGKVNNWGRLNENLVLPEARSKTRRIEQTTSSVWTSSFFASPVTEKVQIVTPIPLTTSKNYTMTQFRRTTRHIHRTVTSTTESPKRKMLFLNRLNSTRLEKVSNQTSLFNRKFTYNSTTTQSVKSQTNLRVEVANDRVSVDDSAVKTSATISSKIPTNEEVMTFNKSEHLSINDIFPFRNK